MFRKILTLAFCLIFLSSCGNSINKLDLSELSDEEVIEIMPEIVFLEISILANGQNIGSFIDNNGYIKEFLIDDEFSTSASDKNSNHNSIDFYMRTTKSISDYILINYEEFIDLGKETGNIVNLNELENYYQKLTNIDIKSEILAGRDWDDDVKGFVGYYGARKNSENELEIILLRGRGDYNYENTEQNADIICNWLLEILPLPHNFVFKDTFARKDFDIINDETRIYQP